MGIVNSRNVNASEEMASNTWVDGLGNYHSEVEEKFAEKNCPVTVFPIDLIEVSKTINDMVKNIEKQLPITNFGEISNDLMKKAKDSINGTVRNAVININGKVYVIRDNYDSIFEELIDNSLQYIFLKQIDVIKERALNKFIIELEEEQNQNEFSVFNADSFFISEAEKALRPGSSWSYSKERANLQRTMQDLAKKKKLLIAEKIKSGEQQAYSFQLLQQQQSQIHSLQQQQYGGTPTLWNVGIAYRPPDSIFNVSAGYQQGKANIQITMVPDEHASLLGSTGFTSGVGPGNLGISLNLNI